MTDAMSNESAYEEYHVGRILSNAGEKLWRQRSQRVDSTPTISDAAAPAGKDRLGREAWVKGLARRIRSMRKQDLDRPLFIHLHGPWGSGKTSILNMISQALQDPDYGSNVYNEPFFAVEFNAWQYQRIEPPWWSLIGAITDQMSQRLRGAQNTKDFWRYLRLNIMHFGFRIWSLKGATIAAALLAIVGGAVLLEIYIQTLPTGSSPTPANSSVFGNSPLLGIFSLIGGIFTAGLTFFGFLFPKPEEAAERFVGSRADPLLKLQRHISYIVRRLGRPLAVLVDDLDRCEVDVVVRFLEGIQTLFRDAPVTFVVAADRKWLHQSFEVQYENFRPVGKHLARPLGFLFLEKTFQLSVAVPPISHEYLCEFWRSLLRVETIEDREDRNTKELKAETVVDDLMTEGEILNFVKDQGPEDRASAARAAVRRLSAPDLEVQITQHRLEKFAPLLESNPRSMKRLVMAYGMNQAADIILEEFTDPDQIALWTILSMRWPHLAEWLERYTEKVDFLTKNGADGQVQGIDNGVLTVIRDEEFLAVLRGQTKAETVVPKGLDLETLRRLANHSSAR